MALSGACAATIGLTFGGPPLVTLLVAIVWGVTIIADSAQFSTAITELSPAAYVGTALTTQTCVGFALTMVSIWLVPRSWLAPAGAGPLRPWRSGRCSACSRWADYARCLKRSKLAGGRR